MAGFDLIIFDCDGVLVDSEIIAAQVESKLLTDAGYPISAEELAERFAGLTWKDILFEVEREASIPFSATLLDASEALLDKKLGNEVLAIDGAAQAIARIPGPRCICSNSSSHRLKAMLAHTPARPAVWRACLFGQGRGRRPHQAGAGRVSSRGRAVRCKARQCAGDRGFGARHPCGNRRRHAGRRVYRRIAQLSGPCRQADKKRARKPWSAGWPIFPPRSRRWRAGPNCSVPGRRNRIRRIRLKGDQGVL